MRRGKTGWETTQVIERRKDDLNSQVAGGGLQKFK